MTSQLPKDTAIEIWFQDEARVEQKNKLVYQWAKKGTLVDFTGVGKRPS